MYIFINLFVFSFYKLLIIKFNVLVCVYAYVNTYV